MKTLKFIIMVLLAALIGGLANSAPFNLITALFSGVGVSVVFQHLFGEF